MIAKEATMEMCWAEKVCCQMVFAEEYVFEYC